MAQVLLIIAGDQIVASCYFSIWLSSFVFVLDCVDYNVMLMRCLSLSYLRIRLDVYVGVLPAVGIFVAVIFVDSVWSRMSYVVN